MCDCQPAPDHAAGDEFIVPEPLHRFDYLVDPKTDVETDRGDLEQVTADWARSHPKNLWAYLNSMGSDGYKLIATQPYFIFIGERNPALDELLDFQLTIPGEQ